MESDLPATEQLVYQRWGGHKVAWGEVEKALAQAAHRSGFRCLEVGEGFFSASYRAYQWQNHYGKVLGWSLHCGNIAAISTQPPQFGLPPEFHLTSQGPLFEALSADGALTMPDADWLLSPLSTSDKAALNGSPNGWEAYSFRRWKPHTRAEALFNHWD